MMSALMSAHQIRVHLQYLGHPIANDPLYGLPTIWGENLGRGGVDLVPTPNARPSEEVLASRVKSGKGENPELSAKYANTNLEDRAYANIDAASPILLSQQARDIIAKLRRARDEAEDWIKWVIVPSCVTRLMIGGKKSCTLQKTLKRKRQSTRQRPNYHPSPLHPNSMPDRQPLKNVKGIRNISNRQR